MKRELSGSINCAKDSTVSDQFRQVSAGLYYKLLLRAIVARTDNE
jgi:hypothetical protein